MSIVVAEGVVEVTADANAVPKKIAKDIENDQTPVRNAGILTGKSIIGGILGSVAVLKTVDWFSGAITGASDLAETMNKSNTIFGTASGVVDRWGDTATTSLGLTEAAALDAAAGFGNMFTQLGYTSAAAADVSTKTVQMAADLGSFNNLPTADVADRIAAALRGEYDSLQALIPNINAARVEQEAMAATGKTSADQLTAQEKAAATLAIVQKDGAAAMGDFAKTSDEFANSAKITTAELGEMQAEVGTLLLPALKDMLGFVRDSVLPVFSDLVEWTGKNGSTIAILAGVVTGTVVAFELATAAMAAYKAFQIASAAATGGLTVAQWALNVAMSANPIGIIIVAIGALVAAIVWIATQTTFFQDVWTNVTGALAVAWEWLWGILEPIFTTIGDIFTWLYENVLRPIFIGVGIYIAIWVAIFTWLWENVLSPIFAAIGAVFTWLYENVISPVITYIVVAVKALGIIFEWLWANIISPVFEAIGAAFEWIWENVISPVVDFINTAITSVGDVIHDIFGGIADFIGGVFASVLSVVKGPINGLIGLINNVIKGLNSVKVTIPDWVPDIGGQTFGLNIPRIPMLARGSRSAPDTFIAGENGPELITGARGSRVYSNNETRDMLSGQGGGNVSIGTVVLDAKNVREFTDVVEMIRALPQVARTGRGQVRMGN